MTRLPARRTTDRGGRRVRRAAAALAVAASVALPWPLGAQNGTAVSASERGGVYGVSARFEVPETSAVVLAALTDYPAIPRFMPEVRHSRIVERGPNGIVVEQEAIARFLLFTKRVHLLLEVSQDANTIRFRDRCGESFSRYDGTWTVAERQGVTQVTYALSAQPSFDVPKFLLTRLMRRDASQMIERLKLEIGARARRG